MAKAVSMPMLGLDMRDDEHEHEHEHEHGRSSQPISQIGLATTDGPQLAPPPDQDDA